MNKNLSRKVTYILAIIGLLLPLFVLGRPRSGAISQLRERHDIGQTYLGELDPTSESMRLATLGMKGIASSILWLKADHYKEEKYFDRFSATLNQISLLQPHFISVWQHQAHNLSYNVSPEFEDYRQRYEWVKKGIDYLVRGTKFNQRKPILEYDLGHYVGNKLGKFDEKVQYRELFRKDKDFHDYFTKQGLPVETDALGYDGVPDNWRVGKLWFRRAVDSFQSGNKIAKTPHLLYSYSPLWQMYYGEAIQSEGILDDRSRFAWEQGGREWAEYGQTDIPWSGDGQIKLLETDQDQAAIQAAHAELDAELGDIKKGIIDRRFARLPEDLKAAYNKPAEERSAEEADKAFEATRMLTPTLKEVIAEAPKDLQPRFLQKEAEIASREEKFRIANIYRDNVNYGYWQTRAEVEQRENTVEARRRLYTANKLIDSADVKGAIENYEAAWKLWDEAFRKYTVLVNEEVGDDVFKSIRRYQRLTEEDDLTSFPLGWFVEYRQSGVPGLPEGTVEGAIEAWDKKQGAKAPETSDPPATVAPTPATAEAATTEPAPAPETAPTPDPKPAPDAQPAPPPEEPKPAPVEEPAKDEEPAKTDEPKVEEPAKGDSDAQPSNRPPVLENPDQNS